MSHRHGHPKTQMSFDEVHCMIHCGDVRFTPESGMCGATRDVRYGPIADHRYAPTNAEGWPTLSALRRNAAQVAADRGGLRLDGDAGCRF